MEKVVILVDLSMVFGSLPEGNIDHSLFCSLFCSVHVVDGNQDFASLISPCDTSHPRDRSLLKGIPKGWA